MSTPSATTCQHVAAVCPQRLCYRHGDLQEQIEKIEPISWFVHNILKWPRHYTMLARCITRTSYLQTSLQLLKAVFVFWSVQSAFVFSDLHQCRNLGRNLYMPLSPWYVWKRLRILSKPANPFWAPSLYILEWLCYKQTGSLRSGSPI